MIVNESNKAGKNHELIQSVHIPESKAPSYGLVRKLFNNYTLDQTMAETGFPEEEQEVQDFLKMVHNCPPMEVARLRERKARAAGEPRPVVGDLAARVVRAVQRRPEPRPGRLRTCLRRRTETRQGPGLPQLGYYLDENLKREAEGPVEDSIEFVQGMRPGLDTTPEVASLSFNWNAFDYEAGHFRPLHKPHGSFRIGPASKA